MDFEQLKTKNSTKNLFYKNKKVKKYWTPDIVSKVPHKNIIRFLPASSKNSHPIYSFYTHTLSFNGKYKTVICSKNEYGICPICEFIELFKKINKDLNLSNDLIFNLRRSKKFVSNIYVIEDGRNPNNNNNVFVYKFGQKIFDKLQSFYESFEDETVDIFSFWSGYDFILRVDFTGSYPNYDKSSFKAQSSVLMNLNDEALKKLWLSEYDLENEIKSLSYEELKNIFYSFYDAITTEELLANLAKINLNEILSVFPKDVDYKNFDDDSINNDSYCDTPMEEVYYSSVEDDENNNKVDLDSIPF